jgi:hypothetical protein
MRDPERIDAFCKELAEVWKKSFPDWRFGQLFNNLQRAAGSDLFYFEEDDMMKLIKVFASFEE